MIEQARELDDVPDGLNKEYRWVVARFGGAWWAIKLVGYTPDRQHYVVQWLDIAVDGTQLDRAILNTTLAMITQEGDDYIRPELTIPFQGDRLPVVDDLICKGIDDTPRFFSSEEACLTYFTEATE